MREKEKHLTEVEIDYYLEKYKDEDSFSDKKVLEIEEHIIECDKCTDIIEKEILSIEELDNLVFFMNSSMKAGLETDAIVLNGENVVFDEKYSSRMRKLMNSVKDGSLNAIKGVIDKAVSGSRRKVTKIISQVNELYNGWETLQELEILGTRDGDNNSISVRKMNSLKLKSEERNESILIKINKEKNTINLKYETESGEDNPPMVLIMTDSSSQLLLPQKENERIYIYESRELEKGEFSIFIEKDV